jgi:hypothetical protein
VATFDLRPLSLGEILDRTFSLYRRHFLLFIGIAGIPQLLVLAIGLVNLSFRGPISPSRVPIAVAGTLAVILSVAAVVLSLIAYLVSQGGAIRAVTDLYLGRPTSIAKSLSGMRGHLLTLFGVVVLNGLVVGVGMIALIIPGIYLLCRLLVCVPAALTEDLGARESLSRSWDLTRDTAGRGFVILVLYTVIVFAASLLISAPISGLAVASSLRNTGMQTFWLVLANVSSSLVNVLISPILLIATAIFYFDLRIRKEAFDLQFMMDPTAERFAGPSSSVPSILS